MIMESDYYNIIVLSRHAYMLVSVRVCVASEWDTGVAGRHRKWSRF